MNSGEAPFDEESPAGVGQVDERRGDPSDAEDTLGFVSAPALSRAEVVRCPLVVRSQNARVQWPWRRQQRARNRGRPGRRLAPPRAGPISFCRWLWGPTLVSFGLEPLAELDAAAPLPLAPRLSWRVFVTGATGCIGRWLCDELLLGTGCSLDLLVRGSASRLQAVASPALQQALDSGRARVHIGDLEMRRHPDERCDWLEAVVPQCDALVLCGTSWGGSTAAAGGAVSDHGARQRQSRRGGRGLRPAPRERTPGIIAAGVLVAARAAPPAHRRCRPRPLYSCARLRPCRRGPAETTGAASTATTTRAFFGGASPAPTRPEYARGLFHRRHVCGGRTAAAVYVSRRRARALRAVSGARGTPRPCIPLDGVLYPVARHLLRADAWTLYCIQARTAYFHFPSAIAPEAVGATSCAPTLLQALQLSTDAAV
eukprot:ctg_1536.g393